MLASMRIFKARGPSNCQSPRRSPVAGRTAGRTYPGGLSHREFSLKLDAPNLC